MSEPSLTFVFENVNDWLKFAEGKNGALLVVNSALSFGFIDILLADEYPLLVGSYLLLCTFFALVSAALCLTSFVPRLRVPTRFVTGELMPETPNLLFYGHIKDFTPDAYFQKLLDEEIIRGLEPTDRYARALAHQIVVNARIAHRKYEFFEIGVWLTVAAVGTPVLALVLWVVAHETS